jgi:hypothetical protein
VNRREFLKTIVAVGATVASGASIVSGEVTAPTKKSCTGGIDPAKLGGDVGCVKFKGHWILYQKQLYYEYPKCKWEKV